MLRFFYLDCSVSKRAKLVIFLALHGFWASLGIASTLVPELEEVLVIHSKDPLNAWSRGISDRMDERLADSWIELSIE